MNTQENNVLTVNEADKTKVSDKYTFISTNKIVNDLTKTGWNLTKTQFTRDRQFGKHLLTLEHPKYSLLSDEERLKIHVLNSHNGSTAARFYFGIFRLVCSNGLMVGKSAFETPRIVHRGYSVERVKQAVEYIQDNASTLNQRILTMKGIELDETQVNAFIIESLALRNLTAKQLKSPAQLNKVRRTEDKPNTLWNVFNRVQENLVNGYYETVKHEVLPWNGQTIEVYKKARRISAIETSIKVNRGLWDLTKQFTK